MTLKSGDRVGTKDSGALNDAIGGCSLSDHCFPVCVLAIFSPVTKMRCEEGAG